MSKDEKYLLSIPLALGDVGYQRGDVMHYEFPIIRHINDVLPHVQENKSFIVAERDDYTVINYVMMGNDTFPPIRWLVVPSVCARNVRVLMPCCANAVD